MMNKSLHHRVVWYVHALPCACPTTTPTTDGHYKMVLNDLKVIKVTKNCGLIAVFCLLKV